VYFRVGITVLFMTLLCSRQKRKDRRQRRKVAVTPCRRQGESGDGRHLQLSLSRGYHIHLSSSGNSIPLLRLTNRRRYKCIFSSSKRYKPIKIRLGVNIPRLRTPQLARLLFDICSYPKVLNMTTPNKSSNSQVGNSTRPSVAPTAYENC